MRLHPLGHAMHLVEAAGLRLLFDPLLDDRHHGGVFDVAPPRLVDAGSLAADFLFVSHRHPDHFDVPSLRRLAALDADTVVITPDGLIGRTARRLGFRTVHVVAPDTHVALDGLAFATTASSANDSPVAPEALEWGVALAADGAVLWNQVDTVLRGPKGVLAAVERFEAALTERLSLALVRWCPLLEIEASLGRAIGFPYPAYADLLEQSAALATREVTVLPAAAGARHAPPFTAYNRLVYPVDEARFLRDLRARAPSGRAMPLPVGQVLDVASGAVLERSPHVTLTPFVDDRVFHPHEIPAMVDPNREGRAEPAMRAQIDAWVRSTLAPLVRGTCVLEVVFPSTIDAWTMRDGSVTRADDPDWDARNVVAASWFCEVLEGRRHYGDLLLSGTLRAATRSYDVGPAGLHPRPEAIFLYRALSYSASFERSVEWQLTHG
ncbi:MAG: MBL fold metallo-hydrolase [Sandaracinaceae bacterium]|nr:MBL fold metallo-hydrolase [Sandaracinaceae bacterium]